MKRIAVPCEGEQVSAHFGHASQFNIYDADDNGQITNTQTLIPPAHEPGVLPAWLAQQHANVILAGGIGTRAQQLFAQHGIEVVAGVSDSDPRIAVQAYLEGTLQARDNSCSQDGTHGCH